MVWFVLGQSGQGTSLKCAKATWNYKVREHSALRITCVLFSGVVVVVVVVVVVFCLFVCFFSKRS